MCQRQAAPTLSPRSAAMMSGESANRFQESPTGRAGSPTSRHRRRRSLCRGERRWRRGRNPTHGPGHGRPHDRARVDDDRPRLRVPVQLAVRLAGREGHASGSSKARGRSFRNVVSTPRAWATQFALRGTGSCRAPRSGRHLPGVARLRKQVDVTELVGSWRRGGRRRRLDRQLRRVAAIARSKCPTRSRRRRFSESMLADSKSMLLAPQYG
jgi:hypothetical protein